MIRREWLKTLACLGAWPAGATLLAASSRAASAALALPPDVQPYTLGASPPPRLLQHPKGTAWFLPRSPDFPSFSDRDAVIADAIGLSHAFETYVNAWLEGRVPAEIPQAFLPPGINLADYPSATLVRAEALRPEDCWGQRLARPVSREGYVGAFPDPNTTYLVLMAMFLPFGHKVVLEGEFPNARFFDVQVTPSFMPELYHYHGWAGVGEVPLVDADINPLPGHENPLRVGADRSATRRSYRVELDMAIGDPVELNPAFRPPYFRAPGNRRVGGAILYQGAWGAPNGANGARTGLWDAGQLWLRYYAPDRDQGPLAGVPLPRVHYETPHGQRYFVRFDIRPAMARINRVVQIPQEPPSRTPPDENQGPSQGWFKQTGIFRSLSSGVAINTGWAGQAYVRQLDRGVTGRASDLPGAAAYEQSATSATYVDYLTRGMRLQARKVVVLTGRLPTVPATLAGNRQMTAAQARYWSITGYAVPSGWDFLKALDPSSIKGAAVQSVMDEDLVLDSERRYVIAFSRPQERPRNAIAAAGVTWVDWGPASHVSWTLRWLSVGPEWIFEQAPTPQFIGPAADWAEANFDPGLIGSNNHEGKLGWYLPQVHLLDVAEFELLGPRVSATDVPTWVARQS